MLANNNKHKEANDKYAEALGKTKDKNEKARVYTAWANSLSRNNKNDEAIEKYKNALLENPASISCYLDHGRMLQWRKNDPEQALRIYKLSW